MFGRKRVPVLRIDKLSTKELASPGTSDGDAVDTIQYTFSADPEVAFPLRTWDELGALLNSLGTGIDRTRIRFARSVGKRRVAAEASGSARLDRLFLRWSDSGLSTRSTAPWWFTTAVPTGRLARVPLGNVPANFDGLNPDDYGQVPGLDLTAVPAAAIIGVAEATGALQWFLTTWPDESSPALEWTSR